jgi:hypothetical protein
MRVSRIGFQDEIIGTESRNNDFFIIQVLLNCHDKTSETYTGSKIKSATFQYSRYAKRFKVCMRKPAKNCLLEELFLGVWLQVHDTLGEPGEDQITVHLVDADIPVPVQLTTDIKHFKLPMYGTVPIRFIQNPLHCSVDSSSMKVRQALYCIQ